MKNYLFILFFCACACTASAQLVPWRPDLQLTWDNFHGLPPDGVTYYALTAFHISYKWKWDSDGTITCTVDCALDEDKSWRKRDKELTPALLRHEQLHLNVAELFARKIRQAFKIYTASHKHTDKSDADLKKIFNDQMQACSNYNALYDSESNHSINAAKQQEWDKKITTELASMAAYAK